MSVYIHSSGIIERSCTALLHSLRIQRLLQTSTRSCTPAATLGIETRVRDSPEWLTICQRFYIIPTLRQVRDRRSRDSSLCRGSRRLDASWGSGTVRSSSVGRRRGGTARPALLAARGDRLQHAGQARLPRLQPLLEELPLFALERAGGGTVDVQRLRGLRELAGDKASTDD